MAVFLVYPFINTIALSFTDYNGIMRRNFVGLLNYIRFFKSRYTPQILGNNLYFIILGVPLNTIVPLLIAVLLFEDRRGHRAFRLVFLFPRVFSAVIIGILFRTMFSFYGPFNGILRIIGLGGIAREWFADGLTSIPIIVLAKLWVSIGVNVMIYHAGMSSIAPSIFESAELDGFNWFQRTVYITLPMIRSVFEFIVVLALITMLASVFGLTFTITGGGPGYESTSLEYLIYTKGFQASELGYASMVSVILFAVVLMITRVVVLLFREKDSSVDKHKRSNKNRHRN